MGRSSCPVSTLKWWQGEPEINRRIEASHQRRTPGAMGKQSKKRIAGLRLEALDIGWEYGMKGQPEVVGSAEALVMGMANRPAAQGT